MGLLSRLFSWGKSKPTPAVAAKKAKNAAARRCLFEAMEPRTMLDADPIKVGIVYIEEDSGSDKHGDTFMIKFEGGEPGTELTHLEINGDHGPAGLSFGDMIFDTVKGGYGADEAFPLQIVSQGGIQQVHYSVVDGTSILRFDFVGFHAGDKLIFTIDVDEVQEWDPNETNLDIINQGIDPIASGVEFQGSTMTATFKEPHSYDVTGTKEFRNLYDPLFAGSGLLITGTNPDGLPYDDYQGKRDRSTGTMLTLQQTPLPISIAGRVYLDNNMTLTQDSGEPGIVGVKLSLWKKVGDTFVDTGLTTLTNAQGDYEFGTNLNLKPGTYQVRETQPVQYFSVGAVPGNVSGTASGSTVSGNPDILTEINIPRGGLYAVRYDFAEAEPSSLSGYVHLTDRDGNCDDEGGSTAIPLANVLIELRDSQGNLLQTALTDDNGYYEFKNLRPGNYTIIEKTPDGLLDGDDHVGTINSAHVGNLSANDTVSQITLGAGQNGVHYDFCEHEPGRLSGYVYYDRDNDGLFDIDETPIPGAVIKLFGSNGQLIGTTTTDDSGYYEFTGLVKDLYTVIEEQPAGYRDGKDTPGTIGGQTVGTADNPGDRIRQIDLRWGDSGVDYNFGEILPASISGKVFVDRNDDCIQQNNEESLAGVKIELLNEQGIVVQTTFTDADGKYEFKDLLAGKYSVRETQPGGYLQGGTIAGSKGGNTSVQDLISQINIDPGDALIEYNFCEQLPVSIEGMVYVDTIHNCVYDPGEVKLAGVKIRLFDGNGNEIGSTLTDANGHYKFSNLRAGTYTVVEMQPAGYMDGGQTAGNYGGNDSVSNIISSVTLVGGNVAINYDFCEIPPGMIAGTVFRDGAVIQTNDGQVPVNLYDIRDGKLTADDYRIPGVYLELRHTLTGEPVMTSETLPGTYNYNGRLVAVTDANGYYEFRGLPPGNYTVLEIQPKDYYDAIDTPGTQGGLAVNKNSVVSNILVQTFALAGVSLNDDAILQIPLGVGQVSLHNNFSEVQVTKPIIPWTPPKDPPPPPKLVPPLPLPPQPINMPAPPPPTPQPEIVTGGNGEAYTWHLSVVDAGLPRVNGKGTRIRKVTYRQALQVDNVNWRADQLQGGTWRFDQAAEGLPEANIAFGMPGAIPVVGDWDGDGTAEMGLYYEGEWFLDLNGNKHWDKDDLWAKLGSKADVPVVGDWDGDGKDDIGIFGPEWPGDPRHIEFEPGLPDPENREIKPRPKNVPPEVEQATDGDRLLRLTSQGNERADLIDHVFRFGEGNQYPIVGDWNGDGISTIGVFKDGNWTLDSNGDGRLTSVDLQFEMGEKGDRPVVGDFNGDGIDEIGVYRAGRWIIDTNGNRQIDDQDKTFEMGTAADRPVVGDFNGDGTDDPGLYRDSGPSGVASTD